MKHTIAHATAPFTLEIFTSKVKQNFVKQNFVEIFFHKIEHVLQNEILQVMSFESGPFTLKIFLQNRLSKGNFEIKISSTKGA